MNTTMPAPATTPAPIPALRVPPELDGLTVLPTGIVRVKLAPSLDSEATLLSGGTESVVPGVRVADRVLLRLAEVVEVKEVMTVEDGVSVVLSAVEELEMKEVDGVGVTAEVGVV